MSGSPKILSGKWLSGKVHQQIAAEVDQLSGQFGRVPGLGVIIVGDNPASKTYVRNKENVANKKCRFKSFNVSLPADAAEADLRAAIEGFNNDETVDGILLQLPLPKHLDANKLLNLIDPAKDADGLHPFNQGLLLRGEGELRPCTPSGVMKLIDLAYSSVDPESAGETVPEIPRVDLSGKTAIIIGRSILVGKPVATMLLERNATVFQTHSRTKDLPGLCRTADIVVAAVGVARLVKKDWVKEGAVVIDVGINRLESGKLAGDVEFESVASHCAAITPVPGGVGPMTIAMLMSNTLAAYKKTFSGK